MESLSAAAYAPPPENAMAGVPAHIVDLLDQLHAESWDQESKITRDDFKDRTLHEVMRDKFIALDQDKAQYVYALCRATGARTIVEAGTSFGVSTIYLALAAAANVSGGGKPARVIATEHEPTKAARAREIWDKCGKQVVDVIDLREGDLRETLKEDLEDVDLLLLDSEFFFSQVLIMERCPGARLIVATVWTPMVLPTLQVVLPKMRPGAVVISDNTISSAEGYKDFLEYMRGPQSPFINLTLPYKNGLEMSIYVPKQS
ncbi:O-methyltransferase [Metarhizium robertsii]|uniref:O-methyltransferase n=2 Tax=Metarhizium robertsii TaxID=568076 RepID=E9ENL2_METRA|nr:O-methyltransferase [Metarhizium robertsii ARSEF 23]EFZ04224.1 O-methyltransferase [Metarhizium robertsii ARSEF 23]EXV01845.1 O-methyltransferase [Metarhizium robertsii]